MWRRLFTLCSVLSLLLCIATGVMWVRSYWVFDSLLWRYLDKTLCFEQYAAGTWHGNVVISRVKLPLYAVPEPEDFGFFFREFESDPIGLLERNGVPLTIDTAEYFVGVGYQRGFRVRTWATSEFTAAVVTFPAWALTLAFGVLPMLWMTRFVVVRSRRVRRSRRGLCPSCSYDLRATPEAGGMLLDRCPECGRIRSTAGTAVPNDR